MTHDIDFDFGENPSDITKLDPELRLHLCDDGGWTYLSHPLVQQVPFYSWKMANTQLHAKRERLAKDIAAKNWHAVMWWFERPYRIEALANYMKEIPHDEFRELLLLVWMDTEAPTHNYGTRRLLRLFRRAGFIMDADVVDLEAMPPRLTLYRGTRPKYKHGLSWTLDEDKARWFANRLRPYGRVYRCEVDKRDILAWVSGRGEREIVIDTHGVTIEEV